MAFMQPFVYKAQYYAVQADHGGTWIVPVFVSGLVKTNADLQDYVEGTIDDPEEAPELCSGYVARMSAPGYLDCTDWEAHDTEEEAIASLREHYGADDESDDESEVL